jgi:CHASE2 domain-containing sensor protein
MLIANSVGHALAPFVRKGVWHWLRFALLLVAGSYAGHVLSDSPRLTDLRYAMYFRQLQLQHSGQFYPQKVALVLLDDDDYWGPAFQARTPLKRDKLALLLQRLNEAGVNLMALDVDLRAPRPQTPKYDFPDYATENEKLFGAIGELCRSGRHIVLATSIDYVNDNYVQVPSIYAEALSHQPCVTSGYIQLPYDMRRIPGSLELADGQHLDSLALALTRQEDPTAYRTVADSDDDRGFRFSQYLTEADFAARDGRRFIFSAADLDRMSSAELHAQFGDRIVFIGAKWHSDAYGKGVFVDTHASPGGDEPGVMLHANYVESMLDRTGTFTPMADSTAEMLEIALAIFLAFIGVLEIHSGWKLGAFLAGMLFSVVLTYVLLQNLGLFLDFAIPLLMIVVHTISEKLIDTWIELREHKRATHGAHTA